MAQIAQAGAPGASSQAVADGHCVAARAEGLRQRQAGVVWVRGRAARVAGAAVVVGLVVRGLLLLLQLQLAQGALDVRGDLWGGTVARLA